MNKPKDTKRFWNRFNIISSIIALVGLVISQLVSDRLTGWGNKMIDEWLAVHQNDVLGWILNSPFNLVSALSMVILLVIAVDWYKYVKQQGKQQEEETEKTEKENNVEGQELGEQLALWVDTGSHIYPNKGADEFVICLAVNVISGEKQKILDLDAHLASIDRLTEENINIWNSLSFDRKNRLEWEDGNYQVELKPGIHELKKLKIAILNCTNQEFNFAYENMPRKLPIYQGNAIYRIRIVFSGKLEGNPNYKHCDYEKEFISVPEQCKLDFLPHAAKLPELPDKFKQVLKAYIQSESIRAGGNITNSPIVKAEGTSVASARDTNITTTNYHYHGIEKRQEIANPKIEIQNISDFAKNVAAIRIINHEFYDLKELRVELRKLHGIYFGKKEDGYPFNPSRSFFDCGNGIIGYGDGSKDIPIASNKNHNLTFLTSESLELSTYETDGTRDTCIYEFELWIFGKINGNPIIPPLQFCGRVSFWRAYQSFDVPTSQGNKHYEGQISQIEMVEIECENNFRWTSF